MHLARNVAGTVALEACYRKLSSRYLIVFFFGASVNYDPFPLMP